MRAADRKACCAAILLMALLAALPPAHAAAQGAVIVASDYRIDVGQLYPGIARNGTFTLTNVGDAGAGIKLVVEGSPSYLRIEPAFTILQPGQSSNIAYHYEPPVDAAPGNHGEDVKLLVGPVAPTPDSSAGSLDAGTSIIFTSRTIAVGVFAIEAPDMLQPGETLAGRVLVVNTGNVSTSANVLLTVANATSGDVVRQEKLEPQLVPAGDSAAYPYSLSGVDARSGEHVISARVIDVDPDGTPATGARIEKPLLVGTREATITVDRIEDGGDGTVRASLRVNNTGTVNVTVQPRVVFAPRGGGATIELRFDPVTLAPTESRTINGTLVLPAGDYEIKLQDVASHEAPVKVLASNPTTSIAARSISAAARQGSPLRLPSALQVLQGSIAVAAVMGGAWGIGVAKRRLDARPKRASAPPSAPTAIEAAIATTSQRAETAPFPAPLRSPSPPPVHDPLLDRVALLVDLCSVPRTGAHAAPLGILRELATSAGTVGFARGFYAGRSQREAGRVFLELERAGYAPHVAAAEDAGARNCHVALTLAAQQLAAQVDTFVLVTQDASFAPLVLELRARGKRVEIAGYSEKLPVSLLQAADKVHLLDPSATDA